MESANLHIYEPTIVTDENVAEVTRIPCQKRETREKAKMYVVTEEDQITEQERDYAEQMLYDAILNYLKDNGVLTAEETQACRERNQMRRRIRENKHEEL